MWFSFSAGLTIVGRKNGCQIFKYKQNESLVESETIGQQGFEISSFEMLRMQAGFVLVVFGGFPMETWMYNLTSENHMDPWFRLQMSYISSGNLLYRPIHSKNSPSSEPEVEG